MTYDDIECALLFVSSGAPFEHRAVIQRSTGEIFYASEITDENEFPDDVDEDEGGCYLSIPHKNDLPGSTVGDGVRAGTLSGTD